MGEARIVVHETDCGAGWFNLLGQAAVTAAIDYTVANHIAAMWLLANGHVFTLPQLLGTYASAYPQSLEHAITPRHNENLYGAMTLTCQAAVQANGTSSSFNLCTLGSPKMPYTPRTSRKHQFA